MYGKAQTTRALVLLVRSITDASQPAALLHSLAPKLRKCETAESQPILMVVPIATAQASAHGSSGPKPTASHKPTPSAASSVQPYLVVMFCFAMRSQTLLITMQLKSPGPGFGHPDCPAAVPQQHCFEPVKQESPPSENDDDCIPG